MYLRALVACTYIHRYSVLPTYTQMCILHASMRIHVSTYTNAYICTIHRYIKTYTHVHICVDVHSSRDLHKQYTCALRVIHSYIQKYICIHVYIYIYMCRYA